MTNDINILVDFNPDYLRDELVLQSSVRNIGTGRSVDNGDVTAHEIRIDLSSDETIVDRLLEVLTAHKRENDLRGLRNKVQRAERLHEESLRTKDNHHEAWQRAIDVSMDRFRELQAARGALEAAQKEGA